MEKEKTANQLRVKIEEVRIGCHLRRLASAVFPGSSSLKAALLWD